MPGVLGRDVTEERVSKGAERPHDWDDPQCDPDALEPIPDAQWGTAWRCPACGREYVD